MSDLERSPRSAASQDPAPKRVMRRADAAVGLDALALAADEAPLVREMEAQGVEKGRRDGAPAVQWCMTYPVYNTPLDEKSGENPLPSELFIEEYGYAVTCLVYQKEAGTHTGYLHYQVAVSFVEKKRFITLTSFLLSHGVKAWVGRVKGKSGWVKWKKYCSNREKEGVVTDFPLYSFGDEQHQGQGKKKETDMEKALEWIKHPDREHATERDFLETFPNLCKQGNGNVFNYIVGLLRMPLERRRPLVYVFYGRTGTGKSVKARELANKIGKGQPYYVKTGSKWWNGYKQQPVVIFDEFRGQETDIPYYQLLQILDRFVFGVEIKGSVNMLTTEVFIFTSAFHPKDWYTMAQTRGDCYSQLERRLSFVSEFTKDYVHPVPDKKWPREFIPSPDDLPEGARVELVAEDQFEAEEKKDDA